MNDKRTERSPETLPPVGELSGLTLKKLKNRIFEMQQPETYVRSIPAQMLHQIILNDGLSSSVDLIEISSLEQCRLILDFDCWSRDRISEERLWEWLELPDEEEGLAILQRFLKFVDLKVISFLISKYVEHHHFDEPTDQPPGPSFYSPDKGHTWIRVDTGDDHRSFLLNRTLAMAFETSPELFYQLLSVPGVATPSMLEEQSYEERNKRILEQGVPDQDYAAEICAPLSAVAARELYSKEEVFHVEPVLPTLTPMIYEGFRLLPLDELISLVPNRHDFEGELSLIMNAALVRWHVDFSDSAALRLLVDQVKGACNLALEDLQSESSLDLMQLYQRLGLRNIFRRGVALLFDLRRKAKSESQSDDPAWLALRERISAGFPQCPAFLGRDGSIQESEDGKLNQNAAAFLTLRQVHAVERFLLSEQQGQPPAS